MLYKTRHFYISLNFFYENGALLCYMIEGEHFLSLHSFIACCNEGIYQAGLMSTRLFHSPLTMKG